MNRHLTKESVFHFFLPFALLVVLAISFDQVFHQFILTKQSKLSNTAKVSRLLLKTPENEVPIFGSSKARSAFIPDSLGSTVFNYGMEKCNFDVIFFLLKIELAKEKKTPIIIEFNPRSFLHAPQYTIDMSTYMPLLHDERVLDFLRENDRIDKYQLLPGVRYYGSYLIYLRNLIRKRNSKRLFNKGGLFMYKYPGDIYFKMLTESRLASVVRRDELYSKAEDPNYRLKKKERVELDYLNYSLNFADDTREILKFEKIVQANADREFLVVFSPQHWSELEGIENEKSMRDLFDRWNSEISNLHAFDYSNFQLPDSCFKNSSHLNIYGARKFSSALQEEIEIYLPVLE